MTWGFADKRCSRNAFFSTPSNLLLGHLIPGRQTGPGLESGAVASCCAATCLRSTISGEKNSNLPHPCDFLCTQECLFLYINIHASHGPPALCFFGKKALGWHSFRPSWNLNCGANEAQTIGSTWECLYYTQGSNSIKGKDVHFHQSLTCQEKDPSKLAWWFLPQASQPCKKLWEAPTVNVESIS